MTDKERLGSIKRVFEGLPLHLSSFTNDYIEIDPKYVEWLIEQAEQVQTLESYMNTLAKYGDDTRNKLLEVKNENKKLREALESIVDIDNHPQFKGLLLEHNDYLDQLTMIEETAKNALQ